MFLCCVQSFISLLQMNVAFMQVSNANIFFFSYQMLTSKKMNLNRVHRSSDLQAQCSV